jgi:hypothetical protein
MLFQNPEHIATYSVGRQLEDKLLKLIDAINSGVITD